MHAEYDALMADLVAACQRHYASRLRALAVFGSVGRGTPRADSDIDVLIVADDLPAGRVARAGDFRAVETDLALRMRSARSAGLRPLLSPVFKTPSELEAGSPLLLDMIDDARLLYDPEAHLTAALARLKCRLDALGARRIWKGNVWIWDLKPDYKPGDVFEL